MKAKVDQEKCTGCGQCESACPMEVIAIDDGIAVVGDECIECGVCIDVCPFDAISLND